MLNNLTTSFVARLRARDAAAWYELWETFGPVLELAPIPIPEPPRPY